MPDLAFACKVVNNEEAVIDMQGFSGYTKVLVLPGSETDLLIEIIEISHRSLAKSQFRGFVRGFDLRTIKSTGSGIALGRRGCQHIPN